MSIVYIVSVLVILYVLFQALELWQSVLSGPLPNSLQHTQSPVIRSTLCDCLAAVGPDVFTQLPVRDVDNLENNRAIFVIMPRPFIR